ncbi:hypothetical protein ACJX0J_016927 [Zea mays]
MGPRIDSKLLSNLFGISLVGLEVEEEEDYATQLEHKAYLLSEHMSMLEEDEIYWRQRSHESWLLKGDGNNEFFHRMANGRKIQNNIIMKEDIINLFHDFHTGNLDVSRINYGIITLLPKWSKDLLMWALLHMINSIGTPFSVVSKKEASIY